MMNRKTTKTVYYLFNIRQLREHIWFGIYHRKFDLFWCMNVWSIYTVNLFRLILILNLTFVSSMNYWLVQGNCTYFFESFKLFRDNIYLWEFEHIMWVLCVFWHIMWIWQIIWIWKLNVNWDIISRTHNVISWKQFLNMETRVWIYTPNVNVNIFCEFEHFMRMWIMWI